MRITRRTRLVATVALLTLAVAAPAAPAAGDEDIVLHRDGSKAAPVVVPEPPASSDGFDWGDAGVGAGAGVGALLVAAAGAQFARRRHTARSPLSAAGS
jgi:hypothetical protein